MPGEERRKIIPPKQPKEKPKVEPDKGPKLVPPTKDKPTKK